MHLRNILFLGILSLLLTIPLFAGEPEPVYFSEEELKEDIGVLRRFLEEVHPGTYRYNTVGDIEALFQSLETSVAGGKSEREWMLILTQHVAKIRCGHTYLNPWNMRAEVRNRLFGGRIYIPLGLKIVNGRFYVTENACEDDKIQRGAHLLKINGVATDHILRRLMTVAKSDGHNYAPVEDYFSVNDYGKDRWEAFDLYFSLFYPIESGQFTIEYTNPSENSPEVSTISALTKEARETIMVERYGDAIIENRKWSLSYPAVGIAHMKIGTFAIWNWADFDAGKWFADAFEDIRAKNISTLIVDIRGNGGGLGEPRDELMSYLIAEDYKPSDSTHVLIRTPKIADDLHPYIETWVKPLLEGLPEAYYSAYSDLHYKLHEPSNENPIVAKEEGFSGKLYIAGGSSNVSATFTMIQRLKEMNQARFIGSTTGGNFQGINGGEYAFLYLPNSQMEVDIPLKYFAPTKSVPDAGIEPDIAIQIRQEHITENRDPLIEWILTHES